MTSLLRHSDAGRARALDEPPPQPAVDPVVTALREELATQRKANTKLQEDMAEAIATARSEGRAEAKAAHKRDEDKALAALQGGLEHALEGWGDTLDRVQNLSLQFTKSALEKAFADDIGGACESAIVRQVDALRRESIICVRVSAHDFPEHVQLQRLADRLGGPCDVRHDETLQRGECHIDLRLGRLELSRARHWRDLAAALDELMADEPPT